jgi:carnitine-CoA ligase
VSSYQGRWVAAELIADRAERWPDRVAVSTESGDISYGSLRERASRVAGGLRTLGLDPGDRVATMLESDGDALAVWHGASWAGVIEAPINTELRGRFLEHQLSDCGARALVVDGRWLDRLDGLELPALEHVVVVGRPSADPPRGLIVHPFGELLGHDPSPLVRREETDVSCILYTSGTTGASKGVVHTNRSICWISQPYISRLSLTAADVGFSMFPLFHTMGRCAMVTTSLWVGCPVALRRRFSVSTFWDDVRRTGATWFGYFGAVVLFLWREPASAHDRDHRVRAAFGASAPADLRFPWQERFGFPLVEVYGSTELGLAACTTPESVKIGTMGLPVDHLELRVHDERDRPTPPGVRGEIVARPRHPSSIFSGYWNRPDDSLHAFRNLWFHSGDAGFLDEEGHLVFVDRLKDSIRRRGENISSFEVEDAVRTHPQVVECAAFGVPSEHGDDEVMVALVLEPATRLGIPAFFEHLFPLMPRYAVPRYVRVLAELPKTPSQRVRKIELREAGVTSDTVDREALGIHPPR